MQGYRHRLPAAVCAARKDTGCIRGYHADVDTEALGFGVTVFANVRLHSRAEADLVAFEERVSQWPEVRECHMLAGETDFLLKIVASDWDAYGKFLTTNLAPAPNVECRQIGARHPPSKTRFRRADRFRR